MIVCHFLIIRNFQFISPQYFFPNKSKFLLLNGDKLSEE